MKKSLSNENLQLNILQEYWGYTTFRPLQEEIIQAVLKKKDILALLPTGGGKSICYQIPPLLQEGLCIVVSPLIALMQDQVNQLKQRNIPAVAIVSGMRPKEVDIALDNCIYGKVKFLYVSPERLKTELFLTRLKKMNVCLLAVDEAHCISQWGHDFRPSYSTIAQIKPLLPNASTIALTATATKEVKEDIKEKLQLHNLVVFQKSFIRKNLVYVVRKTENREAQLFRLLQKVPGSAIIYAGTRYKTKLIANFLQKKGIDATFYHAGLEAPIRTARQQAWIENGTRVMVATNAFGMGIDKPNVRLVVHIDLPTTLEAYYQEAGRAGRDEKRAYAVILYNEASIDTIKNNVENSYPTMQTLKQVYQHLANYYQVAVGSHEMVSYDFDLDDFITTYELMPITAYVAIKRLEEANLIQYHDHFFQPTKVYITASHKTLYQFQVTNKLHDVLIKTLAHFYGDKLFNDYCTISLKRLAKYLKTTPRAIDRLLKTLDGLGLVSYSEQKYSTQITFITPRYPAQQLPLAPKKLYHRKALTFAKAEKVLHYTMHAHRCRQQLLLEYFGEVSYKRCMLCDICLSKKKVKNNGTEEYEKYRLLILAYIEEGPCTANYIIQSIDPDRAQVIACTIRWMLDKEEIAYDASFRLIIA